MQISCCCANYEYCNRSNLLADNMTAELLPCLLRPKR